MSRTISERQLAANRANALKSTGPRTADGKAAVRLNSLVHGLRSQDVVLPGEDKQAFEDLRQSFLDKYKPEGPDQLFCVEKMVQAYWRSRRIPKIEADLFNNSTSGMTRAFTQDPSAWDGFTRLSRYEASLDRSFYRALNELQNLRSAHPSPEPTSSVGLQACEAAGGGSSDTDPAPATPENGFARQPAPTPVPPRRYLVQNGKLIPISPVIPPSDTEPLPQTSKAMD